MIINRSRLDRLETKLVAKDYISQSPVIVHVEQGPNDSEQTIQAKIKAKVQAAVGDNPDRRHVVALILEHTKPDNASMGDTMTSRRT